MAVKPELNEIATIEKDITIPQFGGVLRHNDDTLLTRGQGKGLKIYDEIERDCHAYAVLQKRKMAVIAREYQVIPASASSLDKKAADMVKAQLENLSTNVPDDEILPQATGFDAACLNLLDANLKGYSVGEIMWGTDGKEIVATEVRPKDQRRFTFTKGNQGYRLNLLTFQDIYKGEPVPPRKFVVNSFGAKDGNPFGVGLGNRLFWPVFFKRQDITFWLTFVDKFASPTAVGKYPAGTPKSEQDKLLAALQAISSDSGVTIPEGMLIEFLEAARSGSIDTYEKLARYMDEQMSECVLGETMSTSAKGAGLGSNQAEVHNEVRLELVKADSDLLSGAINSSLIKWIVAYNIPGATPPKVWRNLEEPESSKEKSERDGNLSQKTGVKFTKAYFIREYGFEEGDIESVGTTPPPVETLHATSLLKSTRPGIKGLGGVEFAEGEQSFPDQEAVDATIESLSPASLQRQIEGVLKPVIELINSAGDFNEVMEKLAETYPDMDGKELEDMLARAIFITETWGRLNAGN